MYCVGCLPQPPPPFLSLVGGGRDVEKVLQYFWTRSEHVCTVNWGSGVPVKGVLSHLPLAIFLGEEGGVVRLGGKRHTGGKKTHWREKTLCHIY